jgi:hypothetical protein
LNGDVILTVYHQVANNTIDALASCDSESSLAALLQERLSPQKYQVKTAEPNSGQVANVMNHIGEFSLNVMSTKIAVNDYDAVSCIRDNGSMSALATMAANAKKPPKKNAANFGARATPKTWTVAALLADPPTEVYIKIESHSTPCVAQTFHGLKPGVYKEPFTWAFNNGHSPREYNMLKQWEQVDAILPLGNKSGVIFICNKGRAKQKTPAACHPSLLTPAYNRVCGAAFGKLSEIMFANVLDDADGVSAVGIGSSNSLSPDNKLVKPITLRFDGREHVITHYL